MTARTPAPKELQSLLTQAPFASFCANCDPVGFRFDDALKRFLESSTDEVRVLTASRLSVALLDIMGMTDFDVFRDAVLRREIHGVMDYKKQRDHSAHTLNNYLLGWYFFLHSSRISEGLKREFRKRGVPSGTSLPANSEASYFGSIWQYASLLHDIGYMFEGGVQASGFELSSPRSAVGGVVCQRYFNRLVWQDFDLDLPSVRDAFLAEIGLRSDLLPFRSSPETLDLIADELRTVGSLGSLCSYVRTGCDNVGIAATLQPEAARLSRDAFGIWIHHYERFGPPRMVRRMNALRRLFCIGYEKGFPGQGVRILDHGVCGGLLQLQASTLYYICHAQARSVPLPSRSPAVERFLDSGWDPAYWWAGVVWATAATAVHNIQQIPGVGRLDPGGDWPGKLQLSEDPLAYLGVLVDILQEWDRYHVVKEADREPIQGSEVELGSEAGRVVIRFTGARGKQHARKVRRALDEALSSWGSVVQVESGS